MGLPASYSQTLHGQKAVSLALSAEEPAQVLQGIANQILFFLKDLELNKPLKPCLKLLLPVLEEEVGKRGLASPSRLCLHVRKERIEMMQTGRTTIKNPPKKQRGHFGCK